MQKFARILILFLGVLHGFVYAAGEQQETISATARLRKLSLHLRGQLPLLTEYDEIIQNKIQVSDQIYFKRKAQDYVEHNGFNQQIVNSIYKHLRMESDNGFYRTFDHWLKVAVKNRTWDDILGSDELRHLVQLSTFWQYILTLSANRTIENAKYYWSLTADLEALEVLLGLKPAPALAIVTENHKRVEDARTFFLKKDPSLAKVLNKNYSSDSTLASIMIAQFLRLESEGKITAADKAKYQAELDSLNSSVKIVESSRPKLNREVISYLKIDPSLVLRIRQELLSIGYAPMNSNSEKVDAVFEKYDKQLMALVKNAFSASATTSVGLPGTEDYQLQFKKTIFSQSAAYYRIYFCDDMKAVAITKGGLSSVALKGIFGSGTDNSKASAVSQDDQRHASDPKCQTCHRKMDTPKKLLSGPFPTGKSEIIKYDTFDGIEQSFAIQSIGELIPKTQQQITYKQCQSKTMWNWMIGVNIPISKAKMSALVEKYEKAENLKQFLIELTLLPEFYTIPSAEKVVTFEAVKPIFQRCNSCHQNEGTVANYALLPFSMFGTTAEQKHSDHVRSLQKIVNLTAAFHGGRDAKMPTPDAGWRLDKDQELDLIARWITNKAPDSKGLPTITETELNTII